MYRLLSRRRWLVGLGLLLAFGAGAGYYWGSRHVAPYAIIRPMRVTSAERRHLREQFRPQVATMHLDTVDIRANDGQPLRALLCRPAGTTAVRGILLVVHGIANCKESFLPFAAVSTRLGYACVLPDLRAHGESGGENCTFGWYEKEDISLFINWVEAHLGKEYPIGIYGYSLGGAVALQTLEHDHRLDFGIVESTFSSLAEIIPAYQARLMHVRLPALARLALQRAGEIAHFPPDSISPSRSASRICRPLLMAHGTADRNIPIAQGEKNFSALRCPAQWYAISGGTHPDLDAGGALAPYLAVREAFLLAQLHPRL